MISDIALPKQTSECDFSARFIGLQGPAFLDFVFTDGVHEVFTFEGFVAFCIIIKLPMRVRCSSSLGYLRCRKLSRDLEFWIFRPRKSGFGISSWVGIILYAPMGTTWHSSSMRETTRDNRSSSVKFFCLTLNYYPSSLTTVLTYCPALMRIF